ncbi:MAG: diacylglycerol kinase family protein [Myxococcota bacterium]
MTLRVAVIASPKSGANRRNPRRLEQLASLCDDAGARFLAPSTLEALEAEVAALPEIDVLAINGGDGTLHRVLTAAVRALGADLPEVAILPGGTMNIAANSSGWLGEPVSALQRVLAYAEARGEARGGAGGLERRRHWLLHVDERWYGFLWGNGLIARFLEVYEEVDDPTAARAASILARGSASAVVGGPFAKRLTRRWHGEVEVDGEVLERSDWLAVAAGTVEQIGLGFRPFRFVQDHPGQMHAVGLGCSIGRFARELPRVYRRQALVADGNVERAARRLVLRSDERATYMVDGDFHRGGNELVVEVGPSLDLLVPRVGRVASP